MHSASWQLAAGYCNWLSSGAGIPEDKWVCLPNEDGEFAGGMKVKPNYYDQQGYRLPIQDGIDADGSGPMVGIVA